MIDHPSLKMPSFLVQNPLKPCSLCPGLYKVDLVLSTIDRQHLIKLEHIFISLNSTCPWFGIYKSRVVSQRSFVGSGVLVMSNI